MAVRFVVNYSKQNKGGKVHPTRNVVSCSMKQKRRIEALLEMAAAVGPDFSGPKPPLKWCPIVSFVSCEVVPIREAEKVTDPRNWVSWTDPKLPICGTVEDLLSCPRSCPFVSVKQFHESSWIRFFLSVSCSMKQKRRIFFTYPNHRQGLDLGKIWTQKNKVHHFASEISFPVSGPVYFIPIINRINYVRFRIRFIRIR